ncbi:hypothetical protein [Halorarius halobius]|uniref:hypothetical protein n=1 Tax=Halorarius halobius TaxID=2962671 RepID=UPI0020CE4A35|nr:hypothetical protein [Halorarius halobius]
MTSAFTYVVWGVALLLLIPVLLSPAGWAFALGLVILWLAVTYGGRELLDMEKKRRQGERGKMYEVRSRLEREEGGR